MITQLIKTNEQICVLDRSKVAMHSVAEIPYSILNYRGDFGNKCVCFVE